MRLDQNRQNVFSIQTPGKWILSGEHSVLRGFPAIVFPLFSRKLSFDYRPDVTIQNKLVIRTSGPSSMDFEVILRGLISKAEDLLQVSSLNLSGILSLQNQLPLGSGLGASSSLCVAFSEWLCSEEKLQRADVFEFAKNLENLFHGESSGVDIVVVLNQKPLIFKKPNQVEFISNYSLPSLYLSYSGQRGVTKDCVETVKKLFLTNLTKAERIDLQMQRATQILLEAITVDYSHKENDYKKIQLIKEGMELANDCFFQWGLASGSVKNHIDQLKSWGALACKPTGSGGGGYVLSLWENKPPKEHQDLFIPVVED